MRRATFIYGLSTAALFACGLSSVGTGNAPVGEGAADSAAALPDGADDDASMAVDASTVLDAAPATGIVCPLTNQMVSDCSQCNGNPLHCELCVTGTSQHYDVCVPNGSTCLSTYGNASLDWCPCSFPSASSCPLAEQDCNNYQGRGVCVTCGENLTQGFQCQQGGKCNQRSATCK